MTRASQAEVAELDAPAERGATPARHDGPPAQRGWGLALAVLIVGMFMSVLDITIVNVAIPAMQNDFGVDTVDIGWVVTAYSLMLGVVVPASAWLSDRFGLNRAYVWSLLLFAVASALCGLAWNLGSMIAFRILQAVPGGVLPVITLALVYRIVPKDKIGVAMGWYGMGIVFAPALGPTLGGYFVDYWDWRLVFFVNVPVGIAGAVMAVLFVPELARAPVRRFDWLGFVTVAYGLFALLLALSKGQEWDWTSYRVLGLIVSGLLSLALFVVIELEVDDPLLDVRVFALLPYTIALALICILAVGLFAIVFYMPIFLQEGQGFTALRTGLILLPEAVVMGVMMPLAGQVYDRIGPRWPAVIGLVIAAYGTFLLAGINPDVPNGTVILWTCIRAVGMGIAMMAIFAAGMACLPPERLSVGSALNNVGQRVTAALSLAALTAFADTRQIELFAGRAAMLPADDPTAVPELRRMAEQGFSGSYPLQQRMQLDALATSYSEVFTICGWVTAVGALSALLMRSSPTSPVSPTPRANHTLSPEGGDDRRARHALSPEGGGSPAH